MVRLLTREMFDKGVCLFANICKLYAIWSSSNCLKMNINQNSYYEYVQAAGAVIPAFGYTKNSSL